MHKPQVGAIALATAVLALCFGGCVTDRKSHGPTSRQAPLATLNVATSPRYVAVTVRSPERYPLTSSRLDTFVLDSEGREIKTMDGTRAPAWFGSGRLLATITGLPREKSVIIWDTNSGATRELACPAAEGYITAVAGAADGTALALGILQPPAKGQGYKVVICDTVDGSQREVINDVLSGPVWSPDGKSIAYVTKEADAKAALKVGLVGSGVPTVLAEACSIKVGRWSGPPDRLVYSTLDPSGAWTAFYNADWLPSSAGETWLWSYFGSGRAYISPGFKYLAYDTDSGVRIMDITAGTVSISVAGHSAGWLDELLVVTRQTADMDKGGTTYIAALDPSSLDVVWTYPR